MLAAVAIMSFFAVVENSFAAKKSVKKETPTKIKSDIIDINRNSQRIEFLHNVVVEKDDSTMVTEKMTVIYHEDKPQKDEAEEDKKEKLGDAEKSDLETDRTEEKKEIWGAEDKKNDKKSSNSSIERIVADQKVRIFTEDSIATADGGYYDPKTEQFVLEKNVTVNNGTSIANGDKFIYDLITKKGHFVGKKVETSSQDKAQENNADKRVTIIVTDGSVNETKEYKKSKKDENDKNSKR